MKRRQWLLFSSLAALAACADTDPYRRPDRPGRPGRPPGPVGPEGSVQPTYGGGPNQPGVGFGPGFSRNGVQRISGTIRFRERVMLPRSSVLIVRVTDLINGDEAPNMIAERSSVVDGRLMPLPFEIDVDNRRILNARLARVVIAAQILVEGRTRFASGRYPVLTGGYGSRVDIVMTPVQQDQG